MLISDAKTYVGQSIDVRFTDRAGREFCERVEVFDIAFVALYGPCLITDFGEIRLDRIVGCEVVPNSAAA